MIDIQALADAKGIARDFIDVSNNKVTISPENRINTLKIMGYPTDDEAALERRLKEEELKPYRDILDPVTVLRDSDFPSIYVRTRGDLSEKASITWTLELESGERRTEAQPLEEIELAHSDTVQDQAYETHRFLLPRDLPYGYHHFSCVITDGYNVYNSITTLIIRAPQKAYVPAELPPGKKIWGVSVQLYALRSRHNWGVGDFSDLKQLLRNIARQGGQFVGLNPLHAGYPANPDPNNCSPYSPSSRRWLNIIYINVEDVPEYAQCDKAKAYVNSKAVQQKLKSLREREYVDHRSVLELKLKTLRIVFDNVKVDDRRSNRGRKFLDFMEQGGKSLLAMGTYDALQAELYAEGKNAPGWTDFPQEYQNSSSPFVEIWRQNHLDDVQFYCYLQFLAAEQLEEAYNVAKTENMIIGPYRDLAVGVSKGSCDVWGDRDEVFRDKGSVGAPPDPLGPLGQSWGLSPMDPIALRNAAYKPFIELYRANMRSCGALRIDHAAGLYRLWWVLLGEKASTGAYVAMNMHDLLGIIALESQRNRCLILAEDLGTIPPELRTGLTEVGAYSYKLFFDDGGKTAPQDYAPQAMAALTTHDMPTLKGWWEGADLTLGRELGLYTEKEAKDLMVIRERTKQKILDVLHFFGSVGEDVTRVAEGSGMSPELGLGMQVHMCHTACALYSSQLEDWTYVEKPVNVPGTFSEYPNWRRKLNMDLEDIFSLEYVKKLTGAMTKARGE